MANASLFGFIDSSLKKYDRVSQTSREVLIKVNALLAGIPHIGSETEVSRISRPIPLQATINTIGPVYLSVSDWCAYFDPTGVPKDSFQSLLAAWGIPDLAPSPSGAAGTVLSTSSKLFPGGPFPSAPLFSHFLRKFQICPIILSSGVLCPYVCDNQALLCANHIPFVSFLTGTAGKHTFEDGTSIRLSVPDDFVSLRIPTVEALALARGSLFSPGAFSSSLSLDFPLPSSKEKSTPLLSLPSSAPPLHKQDQDDISAHILSFNRVGSSLEVYLQPLISHPAWLHFPAADARCTPHFTHVLSAQTRDIRASVLSVLFAPEGHVSSFISTHKGVINSLYPLNWLFAEYGFGASPAAASLVGPSVGIWNHISMMFPRLGLFGSALHCEPLEFLEILKDYRSALVQSRDIGEIHICSIFETVFRAWAEHNALTSVTIQHFLRLGLDRQFLPNQWLLAAFDVLYTQASELILPISYGNKYRARLLILAFIQAFRNLHCKPGILSPVDVAKIINDQDASQLAPFDTSLESRCLVDLSLAKPESLLKERIRRATLSYLNRPATFPSPGYFEPILERWTIKSFSDAISKLIQGSSSPPKVGKRADVPSPFRPLPARVSFPEIASANNSDTEESSFRVIREAVTSAPSRRSHSPEIRTSGYKREGDRAQSSPKPSPSSDSAFWLSRKLPPILDAISTDPNNYIRKTYDKSIRARISHGAVPRAVIDIPWLKEGYDLVPMYRLLPQVPRLHNFCCICGARFDPPNRGHLAENCPHATGTPQPDFPKERALPSPRPDHP